MSRRWNNTIGLRPLLWTLAVSVFLSGLATAFYFYLNSLSQNDIALPNQAPSITGASPVFFTIFTLTSLASFCSIQIFHWSLNRYPSTKLDQNLRNPSDQMRAVLDTTVNGIVGLDPQGMVNVINPAARHMLGGISEETPFQWPASIRFLDSLDFNPLDAETDPINRALAGEKLEGEMHLMSKSEVFENRYVHVSSALVNDPSNPLKCVIVLDDVSLLEKNRQQIERKGRLDALGQLTGGIAHDFNNLLATIQYAMQLTRTDEISERSERVLQTALSAVERGRDLTGRLLAFAKRQPGLASSRALVDTFADFKALAAPSIEESLEISTFSPDADLMVYCDHGQLDNALLNLVLNSRDAILRSGKGSKIIIRAHPVETAEIDLTFEPKDLDACITQGMKIETAKDLERHDENAYRYVEISVTDDGPGMENTVKNRAVDPFFTTKDASSGSGLGLSMVYGFIQQSGGELRIYSEIGIGTTIRMILPRCNFENAREEPKERLPAQRGTGQRILVAEDEKNLLDVMAELLKELGFVVIPANSGQSALSIIESDQKVDLLLTDIVMPDGIGGFELAKKARQIRPDLPMVYMSGYTGFTTSEMGGVVAPLVHKPCPPTELADVLAKSLKSKTPVSVDS